LSISWHIKELTDYPKRTKFDVIDGVEHDDLRRIEIESAMMSHMQTTINMFVLVPLTRIFFSNRTKNHEKKKNERE
jgi:hypothetical protein